MWPCDVVDVPMVGKDRQIPKEIPQTLQEYQAARRKMLAEEYAEIAGLGRWKTAPTGIDADASIAC